MLMVTFSKAVTLISNIILWVVELLEILTERSLSESPRV